MQPSVKRKPHAKNKEQTNSISYRLPSKLLENLETEARQKNISHNVLVKQILQKYVSWERFAEKIGMVPVPQKILQSLGGRLSHQEILEIIDALFITIKDSVIWNKRGQSKGPTQNQEIIIETLKAWCTPNTNVQEQRNKQLAQPQARKIKMVACGGDLTIIQAIVLKMLGRKEDGIPTADMKISETPMKWYNRMVNKA